MLSVKAAWRASTRLRQEMPRAATAWQVNIPGRKAPPQPTRVKDARQTPTHLRRATHNPTALASLGQQALMAARASSVWRGRTRLQQDLPCAPSAQQLNIQWRSVPRQMFAKAAPCFPAQPWQATS